MVVARESLIRALKEMVEFEEMASRNLAEVGRYDFSHFARDEEIQILSLLRQLDEDAVDHNCLIGQIIGILENES